MLLELIPIGTVLAVITTQVIETAIAAQDVLIEKESFRLLGKYIHDIQPLLADLSNRELKDSPAVRTALESLHDDLKKARTLIDNCITKPKMYLLVHCRSIVTDAQQLTRDLARSLQLMSLASAEVAVDISLNVNRLKDQMINAQFQASESKIVVINKLEQGLREHRTDQGFANDLLLDIARAVGISVEASEIKKELASFKKEKEESALRKQRDEETFMEQVITLLSRADAAYLPESSSNTLHGRVEREDIHSTELIPPLNSFKCPLKQDVMVDPVSLVTGSCFERSCITEWFAAGNTSDPVTHEELADMSLRPNIPVRKSIEEWQERNYCIGILKAKSMLQSGAEGQQSAALEDIIELSPKSNVNKDWIAREGLIVDIVTALKSASRDVKRRSLSALLSLVKNNAVNKELLADAGGVEQVVRCLGRETTVAKAAAALLLELLDGNDRFSLKIGRERSAVLLLVTLANNKDEEAAQLARLTLDKLSNETDNVVQMAAANFCTPLISRLCGGIEDDASKVLMVKALGTLKLTDQSKTVLAEQGVIAPLVRMMDTGKLETRMAALGALQNLTTHRPIKSHIAKAGAIPLVLNQLLSGMLPVMIRETAAAILDHVASSDGSRFFIYANGEPIEEEQMVENLLAVQENSSNYPVIQGHVLHILLGFVSLPDAQRMRETTRSMHGISLLLPLIGSPDHNIRASVIQILYYLSDKGGADIAEYLQKHEKFPAVLKLLDSSTQEDSQAAAAGVLAALPQDDAAVTSALMEADAIRALVSVLEGGSPKVKEAAMGALLRFTDSSNIEMQRSVANMNIHPLLVRLIHSGTSICKARAATALANFSKSTILLSVEPDVVCSCLPSRLPKCKVHCGTCSVKTTFCLVVADAVPGLVDLIHEGGTAAEAGLEALETLISDDDILLSGAQLIHTADGINAVLDILTFGTQGLREKGVMFLGKIFMAKGMKETYGSRSRIPLVELASSNNSIVRKHAAKVLAQLQFIHEVSTYY